MSLWLSFRCVQLASLWIRIPGINTRGRVTPYNGLYGESPPERGTYFRLQVYERVGISLVEVYEMVHFISVCKKAQEGYQMYFMVVKKSRKRSGFVIFSCLKDSAFTAVKRDYHLSIEGIWKGYFFCQKFYTKGCIKLCCVPPWELTLLSAGKPTCPRWSDGAFLRVDC